ncbi:hypothetical protein CANINC_005070 [Pichia inconspicua]|uniref:Protein FYV8 n=1 Tax=Pichia inconspicua TaxID=52247 RepID=A0A4T0WUF7_9ASCO|nr:hypothetical protein CANINC_005070 [[Candida] inconspicua]
MGTIDDEEIKMNDSGNEQFENAPNSIVGGVEQIQESTINNEVNQKENEKEYQGGCDYGMDFDDYVENSEESDNNDHDIQKMGDDDGVMNDAGGSENEGNGQDGDGDGEEEEDDEEDDDDDDFFDDSDDEYTYDQTATNASEGLIIPDMGITRESSMVSRLSGESGIFGDTRKPSVAYTQPTLQTLSEEIKNKEASDHEFFMNAGFGKKNRAGDVSDEDDTSRTSTMTSTITTKIGEMEINHSAFISKARYPESIMSTDESGYQGDEDAFSFVSNDDKKYELGYEGEEEDYYEKGVHGGGSDDSGDLTDTNDETDTESIKTQENKTFQVPTVPPIPSGILDSTSILDGNQLKDEVEAKRSEFVRNDMHPSVFTRSTDFTTDVESVETSLPQGEIAKVDSKNEDTDSETIGNNNMDSTSKSESVKITQFKDVPDVDLLGIFKNNKRASENILTLKEIREDLDKINTGLEEWISFNMGEGFKLRPEDEQKLGPHALEAIKNPKPINTTNIVGMNVNVTNVNANVNRVTDSVENTARKLGARGKTLLRKLRHSEN